MTIFEENAYTLILNGQNLVPGDTSKSRYVFKFNGTKQFQDTKIALASCSLFYSWFNISSTFNNQRFSFTFTQGGGPITYNVVIPNGFYTVAQLNSYLQSFCITNGLYLVNASGQFVYYLEIVENASFYAIQLNCYPFPTALPGGWTNPAGMTFPGVATTPQFIIPALTTSTFSTLIGVNPGTYPAVVQATTFSKLSDTTPKINPVENVLIRCNLVNNQLSNPSDVLYSFNASGVGFGSLITAQPPEFLYLDVVDGYFSELQISFVDQSYNAVNLNDSSIIVQLAFKSRKDGIPARSKN